MRKRNTENMPFVASLFIIEKCEFYGSLKENAEKCWGILIECDRLPHRHFAPCTLSVSLLIVGPPHFKCYMRGDFSLFH